MARKDAEKHLDIPKKDKSIQSVSDGTAAIVKFTVYGEPVPKERARTVTSVGYDGKKHTHSYTPEKTEIHEQKIALVYKSIYHGFKFPKGVPLRLACDFFFEIPKTIQRKKVNPKTREAMLAGEIRPMNKKDPDNCLKTVADAGNGVIYEDDEQIVEMAGRKFYSDHPRTEIFIAKIGEGETDD